MRRRLALGSTSVLTILVLLVISALPAAAAAPAASAPNATAVTGGFDGGGGFVTGTSCGLIRYVTSGTYRAKGLGRGTYSLDFCVKDSALNVLGTLEFVTQHGAQLHGVLDTQLSRGLDSVPITLAGGTKRFRGAVGALTITISQFNESECDPRVGVCLAWDEHGDITGTIIAPK
jgi:hypothetical protein